MSKNKTILFRADSSSTIGTGHIMRDLVLAQKYAKKGAKIIFATQNLEGNINHKIVEAGYELVLLNSHDKKELVKLLKQYSVSMLVIDHYGIDAKYEKYLKTKTKVKILSFDDTYEKHHCDILLNHNVSAEKKRYKKLVPKHCKIKCGKKYTLLRDEFYKAKKKSYKKDTNHTTIFIAMGGADTANLNIKILKVLQKFDNICVNLVTTTANKHLQQLQNYCNKKDFVTLHVNSNKVAKLMAQSDMAIITPSVTVNEVMFMELPFIAIQTAENQKDIVKFLLKKHYNVLEKFDAKYLQFLLFLEQKHLVCKNFQLLSKKEKKIVFHIRNDIRIRKWMYNNEPLVYKEHLSYLKSLKKRDDRVYFLIEDKKQPLGVVDLTNISKEKKEAELGIYANPDLKGQGSVLMQTILEYASLVLGLQKIYAHVFSKNLKAIALYEKFGFKKTATQRLEKKKLVIMELVL
jgi:UDP-2,4-diacetamido-2,4,6-trideoxy-beta-L-altropyranose hydrolase/UDP-4-amino-4,6-dideoxy-N-acetyl-beta-L-altrosamine N-acetyltransferase